MENPDDWVERSDDLIPLTGPHPFNAEPPVTLLYDSGFVTPSSIHYVRNHGPVPRLDWDTHRINITGLVRQPTEMSMAFLATRFPAVERMVTLVCDGNRRKEVNTIKRSKGFNWGPGAISTSVWKGVLVKDVLDYVGVVGEGLTMHVWFTSCDDLHHEPYGTCLPYCRVSDAAYDVMLAYEMNGAPLSPDHGYPVRLIVPGYIGGRMVKWVSDIHVSIELTPNWHHYFDNRFMPPYVDSDEKAEAGGFWRDERFTLYQLNINSVIVKPDADEQIDLCDVMEKMYDVCGYAYSGDGRRIQRVELSLNSGQSWELAEILYPEEFAPATGSTTIPRCWVCCYWRATLPCWRLVGPGEIVVRAWDESFNTQPANITWNLLGMLNNSWYRVRIRTEGTPRPHLVFQHPVRPGKQPGGWMEPAAPAKMVPDTVPDRQIGWEEVRRHATIESLWLVIHGYVYDVSTFVSDHPGGAAPLLMNAAKDSSEIFEEIHDNVAKEKAKPYCIGRVRPESVRRHISTRPKQPNVDVLGRPIGLSPRYWKQVAVRSITAESRDTLRFLLSFKDSSLRMALPWGKHILLGIPQNESEDFLFRPYTPISPVTTREDDGSLTLVIKIYEAGRFTQRLKSVKVGEALMMKGPEGNILYEGRGRFDISGHFLFASRLSLLAAGTGITPIIQLTRAVLSDPKDRTMIRILFSNKTIDDILLHKELSELAERSSDRIQVFNTVTDMSEESLRDWPYGTTRINDAMVKEHCWEPHPDTVAFVCGPQGFVDHAAVPILERIGYDDDHYFLF